MRIEIRTMTGIYQQIDSSNPKTIGMWLADLAPLIGTMHHSDKMEIVAYPDGEYNYNDWSQQHTLTAERLNWLSEAFLQWDREPVNAYRYPSQ